MKKAECIVKCDVGVGKQKELYIKNEYKISVIIPVYNTEKYLSECLESVIKQDLQDIEIICVNDGSEDGSANILEEYSKKYQNIRVIVQPNQGLSCARNAGLKLATGKYVYFLDSDDKIVPTALTELFQYAEKEQTDVLLFDGDVEYDSKDVQICKRINKSDYHRKKDYGVCDKPIALLEDLLKNNDYIVSSCLQLFKTEFLKKIKSRIRQEFFMKIICSHFNVFYMRRVLDI